MSKPIAPMEALLADRLPDGDGWQYEPKWDGFRCIAVREGGDVAMWSKSGKSLDRYFPEIAAMFGRLKAKQFIIDGELVIQLGDEQSFEALQARLHPAESRIRRLAAETPAQFIAFDLLALGKTCSPASRSPSAAPRSRRCWRRRMSRRSSSRRRPTIATRPPPGSSAAAARSTGSSPSGSTIPTVRASGRWSRSRSGAPPTASSAASATTAPGHEVASLLLGLYDDAGLLNHVGFTSSIAASDRAAWTRELEALIEPPGFTGKAPGGPSRWTTERTAEWQPLKPKIVVEVQYDQVTGDRFRHGTRLIRRRPDKAPGQCRMDQLRHPLAPAEIKQLLGG